MTLYIGDKPVGLNKVVEKKVAKTKFGVSIDNMLGNVDENGNIQIPTEPFEFDGTGIKNTIRYVFYYRFYGAPVVSARFSDLTEITGAFACNSMFYRCPSLKSIWLDKLTTIDGSYSCQGMFYECTGLTRVDFPSLTKVISNSSMGTTSSNGMFAYCTNLLEIHFRADAQEVIEGLSGYASKFGATNATIYFDL